MIPVRQNPGTQLKNEKRPAASQRYDRNAAIWPQMWMPIRQTSSNRYDPSSANFMTPIKSVTGRAHSRTGRDGATLADTTKHVVTCARSCLLHLSGSEPISSASAVVICSAGDAERHGTRTGHQIKSNSSRLRDGTSGATGRLILSLGRSWGVTA